MDPAAPRVRAVVLNYNGGEHVLESVRCLLDTDWPAAALSVVVVDNASADGSDRALEERFGSAIELRRSPRNLGFPGNNLAMADLDGVDYVALVNNDAFVARDWLAPLVEALEADPGLGAACPKLVFAPSFVDVVVESPTFRAPGDPRELGVRVSAVEVDGEDAWRRAQFVSGFSGEEAGPGVEQRFRWSGARAVLRAPVAPGVGRRVQGGELRLRLTAEGDKTVWVRAGGEAAAVAVGASPTWCTLELAGRAYDVVQNAGSVLIEGGFGGDRGFLQRDDGRYQESCEVFSWCGGGVLLRPAYLTDVGLFDERFFMYYEDTDLAWRGRAQGWRYRFVPESVIRHVHAATSGEGSPLFQHYVERNRLALLVKNAPVPLVAGELARFCLTTGSYARADLRRAVAARRPPRLETARRRGRSLLGFARMAPALAAERVRRRRRRVVAAADLLAFAVPAAEWRRALELAGAEALAAPTASEAAGSELAGSELAAAEREAPAAAAPGAGPSA